MARVGAVGAERDQRASQSRTTRARVRLEQRAVNAEPRPKLRQRSHARLVLREKHAISLSQQDARAQSGRESISLKHLRVWRCAYSTRPRSVLRHISEEKNPEKFSNKKPLSPTRTRRTVKASLGHVEETQSFCGSVTPLCCRPFERSGTCPPNLRIDLRFVSSPEVSKVSLSRVETTVSSTILASVLEEPYGP